MLLTEWPYEEPMELLLCLTKERYGIHPFHFGTKAFKINYSPQLNRVRARTK
jgi:hypothetical protein